MKLVMIACLLATVHDKVTGEECATTDTVDPVASWHFTAANGGCDVSKYHENPVTMSNITYGQGPNDEANGAAILPIPTSSPFYEYMVVLNPTSNLRFTTAMTFYTHIYLTNSQGSIFAYYDSVANTMASHFWMVASRLKLGFAVTTSSAITLNTWNEVAIVLESTNIFFYVNGVLDETVGGTLDLGSTQNGSIHFGYIYPNIALHGKIACAAFFDVALSQQQVRCLDCPSQDSDVCEDDKEDEEDDELGCDVCRTSSVTECKQNSVFTPSTEDMMCMTKYTVTNSSQLMVTKSMESTCICNGALEEGACNQETLGQDGGDCNECVLPYLNKCD